MKRTLEFHPALNGVPMMPLHEREALGRDIVENEQRFPIITIGGKIVDGRNRYLACIANNITPKVIELAGQDPKKLIASANYFRKHWTTSERAHFAALMSLESEAHRPAKDDESSSNEPVPTQSEAAQQMGVSVASVKRAKAKIQGKKKPKPKQSKNGQIVDATGFEIPGEALPYWNRKHEVQEILSHISAARTLLRKITDGDPLYRRVGSVQGIYKRLDEEYNRLKGALPEHVCVQCNGVKVDKCKLCCGTGVISAFEWNQSPKELRKKREQPF